MRRWGRTGMIVPSHAGSAENRQRNARPVADHRTCLAQARTEGTIMDSNQIDHIATAPTATVSRRTALRGIGGAGGATALGIAAHGHVGATDAAVTATPMEPNAGAWKTWLLSAGDQFRPAPPPDAAATKTELAKLKDLATTRDAEALDHIAYWDAGAP